MSEAKKPPPKRPSTTSRTAWSSASAPVPPSPTSSTRWRAWKHRIDGAVSSSEQSTARLKSHGIEVVDLNAAGPLQLYVDGADECDPHKRLIKGGGAALTREKIIAEASDKFVCIIDPSKRVTGARQVPAADRGDPDGAQPGRARIAAHDRRPAGVARGRGHRQRQLGSGPAQPARSPIRSAMERELNQIPGVVSVGLFARRPADVVIVGGEPPKVL